MMTTLAYIIAYLGIAFFFVAVIARFFMWAKMPMHLRWELYPVAHEGGGRAAYGGSYLEESDWWQKKREVSLLGELKVMVPEILFLVALREFNPKLWKWSFPFHFGLYLVATATILMLFGGVVDALVPSVGAPINVVIGAVLPIVGGAGLVLGIVGAVGLFARRRGRSLRDYTAPADLFNLLFFIVAFGVALVTFVGFDRDFSLVQAFVANLVTFNIAPLAVAGTGPLLVVVSAVLLSILTAYIPTTHMSHFVGKYFAYHAIRWKDDPNLPGGEEEKVIHELLNRPISWAAPHIKGDGKKTWLDAATEEPEVKEK